MTRMQKVFCDEYIRTGGNASEAARRAGYSDTTVPCTSKWLDPNSPKAKPELIQYIAERTSVADNRRIASGDEVLEFLSAVMRGELCDAETKDRINAAVQLGKFKGLNSTSVTVHGAVTIVDDMGG